MKTTTEPQDLHRRPQSGHEERDANIRGVVWFAIALIAAVVAVLFLMRWTFNALPAPQAELAAPLSKEAATELPPEPRLQVNAPEDLRQLRLKEESVLNSYGWVDKQNRIVRIPIDRAIELLAQRGLPPRPPQAAKPAGK